MTSLFYIITYHVLEEIYFPSVTIEREFDRMCSMKDVPLHDVLSLSSVNNGTGYVRDDGGVDGDGPEQFQEEREALEDDWCRRIRSSLQGPSSSVQKGRGR